MVICGATGDLTLRKLGPAIYNLALGGLLRHGIGMGLEDTEDAGRFGR